MCQRGTLRIEAVGTRVGFLYRLSRQDSTQHDWERTICDSLPSRFTTIDALHEALSKRRDTIGDQLGEYLQQRGLFHDNPVRVRRENPGDGSEWAMLAGALMGVGSGLWTALWLAQWWANALIGALTGLVYLMMATEVRTGMLTPTPAGALEISRWLGLKETLTGSERTGAQDQSDSMLAYAVALDVAQPWLGVAVSAPPWFGSDRASSLQGADLDAAYSGFMHTLKWGLTGRSGDAANAAAGLAHELELELLELESRAPQVEKPTGNLHLQTTSGARATGRKSLPLGCKTQKSTGNLAHSSRARSATPACRADWWHTRHRSESGTARKPSRLTCGARATGRSPAGGGPWPRTQTPIGAPARSRARVCRVARQQGQQSLGRRSVL